MVWALSELQRQARRSFIFAPQTALFRSYPEHPRQPPDRELDIVCVVDGKLTLGEAKSSVAMISATEIATLAEVAKELRPTSLYWQLGPVIRGSLTRRCTTFKVLFPRTSKREAYSRTGTRNHPSTCHSCWGYPHFMAAFVLCSAMYRVRWSDEGRRTAT